MASHPKAQARASSPPPSTSAKKAINLLRGWPAPSLLPSSSLQRASAAVLADPETAVSALQYGPDSGYQPLRRSLARWLSAFYGVQHGSGRTGEGTAGSGYVDRIAVTGGASQSIACVLQSYTDPSYTRAVWMVAPCYFLACPIFVDAGFEGRLRAVPEDEEGIDLEYLETRLRELEQDDEGDRDEKATTDGKQPLFKDPRPYRRIYRHIIYAVPSFSNPSGTTMSLRRRQGLVRLARKYDALVICDDVYDMLQWPILSPDSDPNLPASPSGISTDPASLTSALLPRLVDIDTPLGPSQHDPPGQHFGHAISNGSFSKLVGPGMRTGWVDGTPDFALGISQTGSTRSGGAPSQLCAAVLAELLANGELDAHIEGKLKPAYQRRHGLMMDAVRRELVPLGIEVKTRSLKSDESDAGKAGVFGGYFVWMHLPDGFPKAKDIADRCSADENLAIGYGDLFEVRGDAAAVRFEREIRLCFSWVDEADLVEGVERLGRLIGRMRNAEERGIGVQNVGPKHGMDNFK
ncbi:Aspartate/tyrosine/aromatic aminotransferase [Xylariales sp. AK1849]|nr:Aspartate/tyrosine/aromatic aminotransferase [Xylariales sp. AK1849]